MTNYATSSWGGFVIAVAYVSAAFLALQNRTPQSTFAWVLLHRLR